jgi:hypothetical protein
LSGEKTSSSRHKDEILPFFGRVTMAAQAMERRKEGEAMAQAKPEKQGLRKQAKAKHLEQNVAYFY